MAPSVVPPQPTVEDSREDAAAGMQNQDAADDAASGDEAEAQQPKGNGVQTPTGGAPPKKKKKKRTRKIGHVSFFILGLVVDKDKLTWDRPNRRVGKVIMSTEHGIYNSLMKYRVLR